VLEVALVGHAEPDLLSRVTSSGARHASARRGTRALSKTDGGYAAIHVRALRSKWSSATPTATATASRTTSGRVGGSA
jgi:hypothetical protein